jgi:DNA polymerase-3 subunit epsilon
MTDPKMQSLFEDCAEALKQSNDFQVLRRVQPQDEFNTPTENALHTLCILDTETTGLDTAECEVIELGYQIIEFDSNGKLYRVLSKQNFLNEPTGEISAEVTQVTGITFEDVRGHHIDWEIVANEIQTVDLIIAHNAGFDRPVVERYHEVFKTKVWGCSVNQIDWQTLAGVGTRTQEYLAWKVGHFFYDAHRALDDVQALTQLLTCPISNPPQPALGFLLPEVRKGKTLVKATGAPFDLKDDLKSRHYRWNAKARVWQKVLDDEALEAERSWLLEAGVSHPDIQKLKATDTFSIRAH